MYVPSRTSGRRLGSSLSPMRRPIPTRRRLRRSGWRPRPPACPRRRPRLPHRPLMLLPLRRRRCSPHWFPRRATSARPAEPIWRPTSATAWSADNGGASRDCRSWTQSSSWRRCSKGAAGKTPRLRPRNAGDLPQRRPDRRRRDLALGARHRRPDRALRENTAATASPTPQVVTVEGAARQRAAPPPRAANAAKGRARARRRKAPNSAEAGGGGGGNRPPAACSSRKPGQRAAAEVQSRRKVRQAPSPAATRKAS